MYTWCHLRDHLRTVSELEVVLRVVEGVGGHGVHRVRRGRRVEAVVGVRLRPGELAVAVLLWWSHQENRPQGQRLAGAGYALRLVHVTWVHLAWNERQVDRRGLLQVLIVCLRGA